AVELGEKLRAREHATLSHTVAAAYAFDHFGDYWMRRGDPAQARQWFERSRQAWTARVERTPAVRQRLQLAEEKWSAVACRLSPGPSWPSPLLLPSDRGRFRTPNVGQAAW